MLLTRGMLLTRELLKLLLGVTEMSARALLVPEVWS